MQAYTGSNAKYGSAKRKRTGDRSDSASKLSRSLFFKGARTTPQMSAIVFDKAVGRALKKRMINPPEQKYVEFISTGVSVSSTETLVLLNGISLGSTDNSRIGQRIRVTKIEFNGFMSLNPAASGGSDTGKVSLFIDKQVNGGVCQFAVAINSDVGAPYTDNGNSMMLKNAAHEDAFYIIKDWDYTLDANAGVSGAWQADIMRFKCEVPINRVVTYDNSNAGTVADIITNAIYLGFEGAHTSGGGGTSTLAYIARVWFTDM